MESNRNIFVEALQDDYFLSLKDLLLGVFWRRLWVILLVAVVLAALVTGFSTLQTPTYTATTRILIGQDQGAGNDAQPTLVGDTMAVLVNSQPVAQAVIQELSLGISTKEFLRHLTATRLGQSQVVEVSYKDSNPDEAQRIANAVGTVFTQRLSEFSPNANAVTATVWEEAALPDEPTNSNPLRYGLYAFVLGGALGVGLAFLLEQLDRRWRSPEEVEQVSGVPTFSVIPERGPSEGEKGKRDGSPPAKEAREETEVSEPSRDLVTTMAPAGAASEAYRALRTSLLYTLVDAPSKVVTVTSPGSGEDRGITCANLAVVLSQADKSTLVVDCDFRNPAMHEIFGLRNSIGVMNVLTGEYGLSETWQEPLPGLRVVPAGPAPPDPEELLRSERFAQLISWAREEFDYVLINVPPTGQISDPAVLAARGDGILLVLDSQNTRRAALRRAVRDSRTAGNKLLGVVMDNVKATK